MEQKERFRKVLNCLKKEGQNPFIVCQVIQELLEGRHIEYLGILDNNEAFELLEIKAKNDFLRYKAFGESGLYEALFQ